MAILRPNLILSWLPLMPHSFLKLMNRLLNAFDMMEYFLNCSWEFSMNNMEMLMAELGPEDQQVSID